MPCTVLGSIFALFTSQIGKRAAKIVRRWPPSICTPAFFTAGLDVADQRLAARQQITRQPKQTAVAHSLLQGISDFSSPDCVHVFLANLPREVAHKRVDRRDAYIMAHIAQLL
jgi:hypothetical protein